MNVPHRFSAARRSRASIGALRLATLATTALLATPLAAQRADLVMSGFAPSGDYVLEADGSPVPDARLYLSRRAAAILVVAPVLDDPLLLWARSARVDRIPAAALLPREDGGFDIAEGAERSYVGDLVAEGAEMKLPLANRDLRLAPPPALVGLHPLERLLEHSADYAAGIERYTPNAAVIAKLAGRTDDVRVRVYFGTWCSVCKAVLANCLRVARELASSRIAFEFYGLDHPPAGWQDAEVGRMKVTGLPTAVVFRGGREIGRFSGAKAFSAPESSLLDILE